MFKVLIVDDEKWIRKGIIAKLQHHNVPISWIGEASNGQEASEIIGQECPDIVITDIKMPYMDGIELIKEQLNLNRSVYHFIIISGFAEFAYAEQALNMGVSGYILKPFSGESLLQAVNKVIEKLHRDNEMTEVRIKKDKLESYNEMLSFERAVNQIFHSPEQFEYGNESLFKNIPAIHSDHQYTLILIHVDSSNYYHSSFTYQDLDLIKFSIKNLIRHQGVDDHLDLLDNQKDVSQIFALVHSPQRDALKTICDHFVIDIYAKIKKYLKLRVTIAVSGLEMGVTSELFKQAKSAFDLRLIHGSNQIYRHNDFELKEKAVYPEHKFKLLKHCIEYHDLKNAEIILRDIFSTANMKNLPGVYVRLQYLEAVNLLLKFCSQQNIDIEKSMESEFISGEMLDRFDRAEDIANYLYTTILDIMKAEPMMTQDCRKIVSKVEAYIEQNYMSEIVVKDLAQKFAVNSNYLSTIFKQETNMTITKFIETRRLENACQLLRSTKSTIADIAESIGYGDTQYFYRIFKKSIGLTPMEYRNQNQ